MTEDTYAEHLKLEETLLNYVPDTSGRTVMEVWYGPGANGKTTLLNKLRAQFKDTGIGSIGCCSHLECTHYEGKECGLRVFRELDSERLETLSSKHLNEFLRDNTSNGKPLRFIMLTNKLTTFLERSNQTRVYHFPHTFKQT